MPQEETLEKPLEIKPQVLDEAMDPESSGDYFHILGRKVQIKPLKVKYQARFARLIQPLGSDFAHELADEGNWIIALINSLDYYEVLPGLIQILCHNDGFEVSDDDFGESTMQIDEMLDILKRFIAKNQAIGAPVADFFTLVGPLLKKRIAGVFQIAKEKILSEIEKADTTSTASSNPSAEFMDGASTTSPES